ncbi:MAG: hypothetical protein Q8830_03580, partial [Candidatus Phytoplasma australasiaticum]|nr:hypothetical protein [Candidatus Phytoplasma australasiaticum]
MGHPNPNTKPNYNQCIIFTEISTEFPLFYGLTQNPAYKKNHIKRVKQRFKGIDYLVKIDL